MSTTRERIKTVLICVLILGMVYLAYSVWFFDSPFESFELGSLLGIDMRLDMSEDGEGRDLEALGIRPLGIVIKSGEWSRGAVYESTQTDAIYKSLREQTRSVFAAAKEAESIDEKAWREAISADGIFFDYRGNIPVQVISLWLGNSFADSNICGRYFMLSTAERNVSLYVKDAEGEKIYRYDTNVSSERLKSAFDGEGLKEASLAYSFEEGFKTVAPETILVSSRNRLPVISAYNIFTAFGARVSETCLEAFKLRDVSPGTYSEADGTQVYIADIVTLKISPGGTISYTDPRERADETLGITVPFDGEKPSLAEKVEAARTVVSSIAANLSGGGGIYILDSRINGENTEITFGRHMGGIPIDVNGSYFARISIKNDVISAVKINLRGYDATSQSVDVLPEKLVAAAVESRDRTGDMSLRYNDAGSATVSPAWFIGNYGGKADELVEG